MGGTLNHVALVRLLHELSLHRPQQFVSSATERLRLKGRDSMNINL